MSAVAAAADGAADAVASQFVTFQVCNELFALPLAEVQEIIRVPELVEVPLCPPGLRGIANLRGAVLPVASLRRMFATEEAAHDDATRVVVVNRAGGAMGFVVDRMASVITAEPGEIERADTIERTVGGELLRGVVKRAGSLILLLDLAALVAPPPPADRPAAARPSGGGEVGGGEVARTGRTPGAAAADEIQLVSFDVAGQEYALPIADVQEIVQAPPAITRVPQGPAHLLGMMMLRQRLLPLVSLRRLFALAEAPVDEHSRIVVVAPGGDAAGSVGIVMDSVKEVLRVGRSLTEKVPPLLAGGEGEAGPFEAICRLEGGRRLVTILSAERMLAGADLRRSLTQQAAAGAGEDAMAERDPAAASDDEEQFVVFRLAGEEYGVPIETVQEIVRVPEALTRIPNAHGSLEGVVNLRGMVLPVVDQRRRFALPDAERNDRQRIMVLSIAGARTGFIVDQVTEVLKIPRTAIEPAPELSAAQSELIRRVANLAAQQRMILLLETARMLERGDTVTTQRAGAATPQPGEAVTVEPREPARTERAAMAAAAP
jgi:purine-binding chemotaxis protein CheW